MYLLVTLSSFASYNKKNCITLNITFDKLEIPSENEALDYITSGSRYLCKSTTYARAILGYAALGSFGLLLVATKLTASIPNLPGWGVCIQ